MIKDLMYIELKSGCSDDGPGMDRLCKDLKNQEDSLF